MSATRALSHPIALWLRRAIIFTLAGLLVFHHCLMLVEVYQGVYSSHPVFFALIQNVCRLLIILSLLGVMLGEKWALWSMWFSISGLIATQYWAHFADLPVEFTKGRQAIGYLKGYIFPSIISLCFSPTFKIFSATKKP